MVKKTEPLGQHSEINYGYTARASFDAGTHKYLRITDIQDNYVNWDCVPYCNLDEKKFSKKVLNDGDIVFARTGATTGKSYLLEQPINAVFASYLIRVSVDRKKFFPRYIMHYFQSKEYWQQVKKGISGSTQGGFNASKLANLHIPIIDKAEQLKIIYRLDNLSEQSNELVEIYRKIIRQYEVLKTAILVKELQN
ncbi:MAG: restriction endonuclease subunit S [Ekhidna sp.]|nr:restriction endonuclease subunit S [Ekhidna sp.]